jgi:phage recombination protein Bet
MTPTGFDEKAEMLAAEAARAKRNALPAVTSAPSVTPDQIDLITRTVAQGATPDELKLYLFDCARQGVHPLDKLLHFTKRGGKYTPVTSIDFMRTRAAETTEYAGSDDATFDMELKENGAPDRAKPPIAARVTVHRLVQGQRCPFTATARWAEYVPGAGQDHMWRKMPHTMLAKCAEALALRKGFPRQLAGLYASEEMDQAGVSNGHADAAPAAVTPARPPVQGTRENPAAATGETRGTSPSPAPTVRATAVLGQTPSEPNGGASAAMYPPDVVLIERVDKTPTKNPKTTRYLITKSDGTQIPTIKEKFGELAERCWKAHLPVRITEKTGPYGVEVDTLTPVDWSGSDASL